MFFYQCLFKCGFNKLNVKKYVVVNLGLIQKFIDVGKLGVEIIEDILVELGLVCCKLDGVCVLVKGEFIVKVIIIVIGVLKSVVEVVEKVGGKLIVIIVVVVE